MHEVVALRRRGGTCSDANTTLDALPVRKAVHKSVELAGGRLALPFRTAPWNRGRLVCTGDALRGWVLNPEHAAMLAVVDRPIPEPAPPPKVKPIRLHYGAGGKEGAKRAVEA